MANAGERTADRPARIGRLAWLALALVAASITPGCATSSAPPGPSTAPSTPTPTAAAADPIGLVGLWRVSGAAGESDETWLRLGGGELALWRECGTLGGSWIAGERAFLAQIWSASRDCGVAFADVGWLDAAASYRATADGWQLLDAGGEPVASLAIDGAPEPINGVEASFAEAPVTDDLARALFADAPPLPESLAPASTDDLIGRWDPVGLSVMTDPHVVFLAFGDWNGSDGCNGQRGRWAFEDDGGLLTTTGGSSDMWCEGAPVSSWVTGARLAGLDGQELVLLDRDGVELGRLQRPDGL
ncbi:hypothetical protein LQ757_01305 [Agromyces sp. SYSU K20354]|uniref:hypothetical protein n=1 Tax=Agromyces cavernae TaxID=2898659 RepID=UPI001E507C60|nr:hypothetical protein [Agromyces cavernae]MCD2440901.1 hypothetical protein [Agromyces cavernae]